MFGLSQAEKAQKSVEDSMAFLLAFKGEKFVRRLYEFYPNAKKLAIERTKAGEPLNKTASDILRVVLAAEIEKHTMEQRAQIYAHLITNDEEELKKPPFVLADLCRAYATMMFRESDLKKLDEQWVLDCIHEVYYAAKGMNADERSNDRMVRAIEKITKA